MKRQLLLWALVAGLMTGLCFLGCDQPATLSSSQPSIAGVSTVTPVAGDDWSLKIVQFSVGQADAAILLAPNGDAAIVDMGKGDKAGDAIVSYLQDSNKNGLKVKPHVRYIFATHYDADHIGGAGKLRQAHLAFDKAFDQGPSRKREESDGGFSPTYKKYLDLVGDPNGNGKQDPGEDDFKRFPAKGQVDAAQPLPLGADGNVGLRVLAACGDTHGSAHDIDLDPSDEEIDENPGSIIMLVQVGPFRFLTTGDATSSEWKKKPGTEEAVIESGAIPGEPRVDVLKVAHHGSDTSSGRKFILSTRPEVAIISSDNAKDALPKKTSLRLLLEARANILVTGSATTSGGKYHDSKNPFGGPSWTPPPGTINDGQGTITIIISKDGKRYVVETEKNWRRAFSTAGSNN